MLVVIGETVAESNNFDIISSSKKTSTFVGKITVATHQYICGLHFRTIITATFSYVFIQKIVFNANST
jgi:hypothetical protein